LGAGAQQIEDRINDAPQRIGLPPPGRMAAGDKGLKQRPFGIIEIAGIETSIHGGAPGLSNSPHPPQRPSTKPMLNQILETSNEIAYQPLIPSLRRADSFVISRTGVGVLPFGELGRFAMPIPLRSDLDASQLRALARKTKNASQARRLLALAAI
jgi:hypothetical protein